MKDKTWDEVDMDELFVHGCAPVDEESQKTVEEEKDVPLTAAQRNLLNMLETPTVEKRNCYGGVLLQRHDANGKPILSFVVEDMTDREVAKMKMEYEELFRSELTGMLHGADPFMEKFDRYTVFNFLHNTSRTSLRDYCSKSSKSIPAEWIMRKLLNVIQELYNYYEGQYKSLNCFSLDTIFVSAQGKLWLLPLRAFRNCFPCEIAPEAHDPNQACDERSDIYAAAYVAMEVAKGDKLCDMEHLEDGIFKDCLLGLYQCRPSLHRVRQLFKASEHTDRSNTGKEDSAPDAPPTPKTKKKSAKKSEAHTPKLRSFWSRFRERLASWHLIEGPGQVLRTMVASKKSFFRPLDPIADDEEEV